MVVMGERFQRVYVNCHVTLSNHDSLHTLDGKWPPSPSSPPFGGGAKEHTFSTWGYFQTPAPSTEAT